MMNKLFFSLFAVFALSNSVQAQNFFAPNNNNSSSYQGCNVVNSHTFYGELIGPGEEVIAFGPYSSRCANKFHAGQVINLGNTALDLKLQRKVNGRWLSVATGYVRYNGGATGGEYRWVVTNLGQNNGSWRLDVQVPN